MNNKGLTVVELIVAFSLTVVIGFFLLEIVLFFRDTYVKNIIKSDIVIKQSVISNHLNNIINNKVIKSGINCGENCLEITYDDETQITVQIIKDEGKIIAGDYTAKIPNNCEIVDIKMETVKLDTTKDLDSIMNIYIELGSKIIKTQEFDINIIHQYNSNLEDWSL